VDKVPHISHIGFRGCYKRALRQGNCRSSAAIYVSFVHRSLWITRVTQQRFQIPILLLFLFTGYVFYPVYLFSSDVNVQLSQQSFGDRLGGLIVSGFLFLTIFSNQLLSILFTWSLHAGLLILAHLMTSWILMLQILQDIFVTNSTPKIVVE